MLYQNASSLEYMGDLLSGQYDSHVNEGLLQVRQGCIQIQIASRAAAASCTAVPPRCNLAPDLLSSTTPIARDLLPVQTLYSCGGQVNDDAHVLTQYTPYNPSRCCTLATSTAWNRCSTTYSTVWNGRAWCRCPPPCGVTWATRRYRRGASLLWVEKVYEIRHTDAGDP